MISAGVTREIDDLIGDLWPEIYRFIYYKVQNKEEAEELTQDAFKRVIPKLQEGKVEEGKVRAYTFQTARNLLKDLWRKRVRDPQMMDLDNIREGEAWDRDRQERLEERMVLEEALALLGEDYQEVINLRIVEGYSVKETALKMGRNPGAIRSLQYRALQSLREILEERGFFHD